MIDFSTIDYLKKGSLKQVQAFEVLTQHKVLSKMAPYDPILAGTIPINIAIDNSDLDILCYWEDKAPFIAMLEFHFSKENQFTLRETVIDAHETVIANFRIENFEIEIFGQNIPVRNQNGYLHLLIEHEILESKEESFRLEIIKLKQKGYKTEPAFALLLGLKGNPFEALLKYKM
ncbi:DUF4269 domain-containing protein [Flavobacterium sp. GA093]|uniref:DUF4269 domain-containing protein n=1 Tax=Flavobacterium hydrocarbonoxydans TaxID=2683249 RepID=A0A6I4NLX7_9FLAO|nr:DUF4269 domain-containing protein [Flavobacterium hydrocarbonoxydans]MWB95171.1 DUF4269 domain-containing protein [Flavobacterium hydrocarbonoxydans]